MHEHVATYDTPLHTALWDLFIARRASARRAPNPIHPSPSQLIHWCEGVPRRMLEGIPPIHQCEGRREKSSSIQATEGLGDTR